ncbi:hypothetical protein HELRODRAFT_163309 [Helobdella robusta]|uniref:Uncharacterized protein n=1 Tax=Helobdella robusta TaxID=6412 RepID=T1ETW2_HELRO|nr:hypothetical protein HELRODRAFT_163309 [Helobdella robusta]ESN96262.1 hypothetical protein HELRODRAFT_163309 [Helobdella robusta]
MVLSKEHRFLKLVYLFFLVITDVIVLVSMLTMHWLEGTKFRRGLWSICIEKRRGAKACFNTHNETWTLVCGTLCCFTFIFISITVFVSIYHIATFKNKIKRKASMISILVLILSAIFTLLSCLVAFPVLFIQHQMENYNVRFQVLKFNISWSYGLGWAAFIFLIGTFVLILLDPTTYFSDIRTTRKMSLSSINADDIVSISDSRQNKALQKELKKCKVKRDVTKILLFYPLSQCQIFDFFPRSKHYIHIT